MSFIYNWGERERAPHKRFVNGKISTCCQLVRFCPNSQTFAVDSHDQTDLKKSIIDPDIHTSRCLSDSTLYYRAVVLVEVCVSVCVCQSRQPYSAAKC